MKIYHNPRCSKSRKALQILKENNQDVEVIEYLKTRLTKKELKEAIQNSDLPLTDFIRRGEKVYKENFKGKEMSNDEWIEAMIEYPKLMERPIITKENKTVLGRPPENVKSLF